MILLYGFPFLWRPQNSACTQWSFFCHMTNSSSMCPWRSSKKQIDVVKKVLIFVIIWIDSQIETACRMAWKSYRWSWVGLLWLNDEELGRFCSAIVFLLSPENFGWGPMGWPSQLIMLGVTFTAYLEQVTIVLSSPLWGLFFVTLF